MNIIFKDTKNFKSIELEKLFLSVNWESGKFPDRLVVAMKNSAAVFSAWDDDRLIGLVNALDDSSMTAYIHYMLIDPNYHKKGIGRQLIELMKNKYIDYINIVIVSYNKQVDFYKSCGFEVGEDETPVFISKINL